MPRDARDAKRNDPAEGSEGESCPMPSTPEAGSEAAAVRRMLAGKRIAVVGLSDDP